MRKSILLLVVISGLSGLYPLQKFIDEREPPEQVFEEQLLISGDAIRKFSLGLDGLAADIYWIRTMQYFGRKIIDSGLPLSAVNTKDLDMPLLAPLLDTVVTLDPSYIRAYRFGAMFLPERDLPAAIALLERGITHNPDAWRLYQDIGYIYWQEGNQRTGDEQKEFYEKAAHYYDIGGNKPEARWWMRDLAGLMRIKGGTRQAARIVYSTYLDSEDETIRNQARDRLKQLYSLDERDAIDALLARYKESGSCPQSWKDIAAELRKLTFKLDNETRRLAFDEQGSPIDPDGFPYKLDTVGCRVLLARESTLIR
jgi:hypothetical protein